MFVCDRQVFNQIIRVERDARIVQQRLRPAVQRLAVDQPQTGAGLGPEVDVFRNRKRAEDGKFLMHLGDTNRQALARIAPARSLPLKFNMSAGWGVEPGSTA